MGKGVRMALDRDELAARATAARAALLALCDALRPEAVAPAATPAPYVPKCGDVVRHINDAPGTDDRIVTESLCDGAFRMLSLRYSNLSSSGYNVAAFWRFVRRATSSERAAAGLPVDESAGDAPAFDEAKEREAAKVAVSRDAGDDFTRGWIARARVAAKGGA